MKKKKDPNSIQFSSKHQDVIGRWRKWLALEKGGLNANQIAKLYGMSKTNVYYGLARAKEIISIYGELI